MAAVITRLNLIRVAEWELQDYKEVEIHNFTARISLLSSHLCSYKRSAQRHSQNVLDEGTLTIKGGEATLKRLPPEPGTLRATQVPALRAALPHSPLQGQNPARVWVFLPRGRGAASRPAAPAAAPHAPGTSIRAAQRVAGSAADYSGGGTLTGKERMKRATKFSPAPDPHAPLRQRPTGLGRRRSPSSSKSTTK